MSAATSETTAGTWSYRTGEWFAVFGSTTTLLLPASEKARVVDLWATIDGGAPFDAVLDSLLQNGLGALPGFVLVGSTDGPDSTVTRILVRGQGVHAALTADDADEQVVVEAPADATWAERTVAGVTSLTVTVGDDLGAGDLPIAGGLVRVSRVDHPPHVERAVEVQPEPLPAATDDADHAALLETELMDTPVGAPSVSLEPPPLPPVWGAAPVPGPPLLDEPAATDHDGLTRTGVDGPGEPAREQPGIPGQPMAPSITKPVARLAISNGENVDVDRVILVGRAPEARRFTTTDQPLLVTVPSPLHEISSTHLEIRPGSGADHGTAVVTDMGSTNGTVLEQPGLGPEDLKPGIAVQLIPGAVINLGDGVTISVTRP